MSENWPYQTTCSKQKTTFEQCHEDIECQNNQFCWYPSKEYRENGNQKVCLEKFSQDVGETFGWEAKNEASPTFEDFKHNGQYCVTGLAYPISPTVARCTRFKEMMFDGLVLDYPYPCSPADPNKKCALYFEIHEDDQADSEIMNYISTRDKVQNDCKCNLGPDKGGGYCSSIIGTELYEKAVGAH